MRGTTQMSTQHTAYRITASMERDGQVIDCTSPEVCGDHRYYLTRESAQEAADEMQSEVSNYDLDPTTSYTVEECALDERGANAAYVEAEGIDDQACESWSIARCECGTATGERCEHVGPRAELVALDWLPDYLRGTAQACGSARGLTTRLLVSEECAQMLTPDRISLEDTQDILSVLRDVDQDGVEIGERVHGRPGTETCDGWVRELAREIGAAVVVEYAERVHSDLARRVRALLDA